MTMNDILSMSLSFKIKLLVKIYSRKYLNLMTEIKLKHSLKIGFSIQGTAFDNFEEEG